MCCSIRLPLYLYFSVSYNTIGSVGLSAFCALLSLIFPDSQYTTYFMPESFYRLGFWLAIWLFVTPCFKPVSLLRAALLGATIGFLYYIKPHALFVLFAICGSEVLFCVRRLHLEYKARAAFVLTVAGTFTCIAAGIGVLSYAATGEGALGGYYEQILAFFGVSLGDFLGVAVSIGQVIGWHIVAIMFVGGLFAVELVGTRYLSLDGRLRTMVRLEEDDFIFFSSYTWQLFCWSPAGSRWIKTLSGG